MITHTSFAEIAARMNGFDLQRRSERPWDAAATILLGFSVGGIVGATFTSIAALLPLFALCSLTACGINIALIFRIRRRIKQIRLDTAWLDQHAGQVITGTISGPVNLFRDIFDNSDDKGPTIQ